MNRKEFICGAAATAAVSSLPRTVQALSDPETFLDEWQRETDLVKPEQYKAYAASNVF